MSDVKATRVLGAGTWMLVGLLAAGDPGSSVVAQDGSADYVLHRGDEITMKVFNRPELEDTVKIRPDGRISVLILDDVPAAGLSTGELDALLTERYAVYFREPEVTVIVRSFADHTIYVGGEVVRPDVVELTGKLTAVGAVFRAGGFKNTARVDNVILLRNDGGGQPLVMKVNLKAVLNDGAADVLLQPFDVVMFRCLALRRSASSSTNTSASSSPSALPPVSRISWAGARSCSRRSTSPMRLE